MSSDSPSQPQDPAELTHLEVPDPGPLGFGDQDDPPARSPLVPLIVVPALIGLVLVLVFVLFGAIAGDPPTVEENVQKLLHGGSNERDQAAFALIRQVLEQAGASESEGARAWQFDDSMRDSILLAWEQMAPAGLDDSDDVPIAAALTIIASRMGESRAVQRLAEMTRMGESLDPGGEFRFQCAAALGGLNSEGDLAPADQVVARQALLHLLDGEDDGLRLLAAIGLQTLPGETSEAALMALLPDSHADLRLQGALSLAHLKSDAGVSVLEEMLDRAPYEAERSADPSRWSRERDISSARVSALEALATLGHLPDKSVLKVLAEEDGDARVRELARALIAD